MIRDIIFDMDGVIIDSEPIYRENTRRFLESYGFPATDEICNMTCGSNRKLSYYIFKDNIKGFDMSFDEFMEARSKFTTKDRLDMRGYVDKDIYPLLKWLKDRGLHIALASSSPRVNIEDFLRQLGIIDYFEIIVDGARFERSKPDPQIYLYTMDELNVRPTDCLIIEDSTYGIQAGKTSGAMVIAKRDDRFGYDQTPADYIIDSLLQTEDIITELNS